MTTLAIKPNNTTTFTCPVCATSYRVKDPNKVGIVNCKECGGTFRVSTKKEVLPVATRKPVAVAPVPAIPSVINIREQAYNPGVTRIAMARPFMDGISFGMGLIVAPFVLVVIGALVVVTLTGTMAMFVQ